MDDGGRICSVGDLPGDSTFLFRVRDVETDEQREAILVRLNGEVAGWLNYCQHFTHITLDKGSGAEMRDGEIICTNHGAYFESDTGLCTFGPCEGAVLNDIVIEVDDGDVYLVDEDYEFVAVGPIETDEADLVSKSNYEF